MDVAKLEASLAEAKKLAEEAGGTDENLNSALKSAEDALSKAKAQDDPSKKKFSRRERLNFEKKKIEEQLSGLDKEEGVKPTSEEDDDKPLTKGEFKKMQKKEAQETALTLAEALEDETDREQVKNYLQNRIVPSGNAEEDFKLALSAVSALKNAEIVAELGRKTGAKAHSSGTGAPAKVEKAFEPTDQERVFMSPPYNLTKDDILKARAKTE